MPLFSDFRVNRLGTCDVDVQLPGMRKPQSFTCLPLAAGETTVVIQSNTRIGKLDLQTGEGCITPAHSSGAYFAHLITDNLAGKLQKIALSAAELNALKAGMASTKGNQNARHYGILVDNSGVEALSTTPPAEA